MKGLKFIPELARAVMRETGPKTVTRRVIVPQPTEMNVRNGLLPAILPIEGGMAVCHGGVVTEQLCCDYVAGERRCLLTTWAVAACYDYLKPTELTANSAPNDGVGFWHAGMGPKPEGLGKSRPGMFLPLGLRHLMPVFEVVSVRAERVQDITEEDAVREGIWGMDFEGVQAFRDYRKAKYANLYVRTARDSFSTLWGSINAERGFGWERNPWVWRIEIREVKS